MKIWQIELTNNCNFSCDYCPRTESMTRSVGKMSEATINRIADICSSEWIRLHHYGESLLYPKLAVKAIQAFKAKGIKVGINSNGSATTLKNVMMVFDAGLDELVISWHPLLNRVNPGEASSDTHLQTLIDELPKKYLDKIHVIRVLDDSQRPAAKLEMLPYAQQGLTFKMKRLRNLGGVFDRPKGKGPDYCSFLDEPEFAVLYDGTIVSCCEVYDDKETMGNVHDNNLPVKNTGCSFCAGCIGYGGNSFESEKEELVV